MSNFTRFNHKPLVNPGYKHYDKDVPFKKAADLYAIDPERGYTIHAMYRSTSDYGDQIVACVSTSRPDPLVSFTVDVFRIAFPRKYTEIINVDDPELIDDCNNGLAIFRITQYHSKKFNKELYDIKFL